MRIVVLKLIKESPTSKVCSKCKEEKSLEEFSKNKSKKDGRQTFCKSCDTQYYATNKDKIKEYLLKNKEKIKNYNREYKLKKKFGISLAKYNSILEDQEGKCFICGRTPKQIRKKQALAVDHCHDTGRIRGLLCYNCNHIVLPYFEDRIDRIENLKEYLTRETDYGYVPTKDLGN